MGQITGYYNTFVLRIWREEQDGKITIHIQHTNTQEDAHFANLDDMNKFILKHLCYPLNNQNINHY
jgi:hypothetical protein